VNDDIVQGRLTAPVGDGNGGTLPEIASLFLRLGCTAFGGPAAHVPLMETEVVTRRGWMTRAEFLDHLGVVQVLPGPNSTELAIHLGHARGGWRGGVLAGLCFISPAVVIVGTLAAAVSLPMVQPLLVSVTAWLAPVVVAVLAAALWLFGRQAMGRPGAPVVMPLTAAAAMIGAAPDPLVLGVGAVAAMFVARALTWRTAAMLLLVCAAVACAAVAGAAIPMAAQVADTAAAGGAPTALQLLLYFLRAGITVFGSGYVLFAVLQRDLVDARGWLTLPALTQASALAQVTPGPLFTTATAAGYAIAGPVGAIAATVGIFAPAFLSVAVGPPVRRLVQRSPMLRAALDGVVIASVALLGRAVVGFALPLSAWQWGVALASLLLVSRGRVPAALLLLLAVCAGLVASILHPSLP